MRARAPGAHAARLAVVLCVTFIVVIGGRAQEPRLPLPPFLDVFRGKEPKIVERVVRIPSAAGAVGGYLTRQESADPLPAVILLHDEGGLSAWMKDNARDMAGIGFVILALEMRPPAATLTPAQVLADEATLARLSAAVRWLRRQNEVMPDRVGVVGWSGGGAQALALAASTRLEACVVCSSLLSMDADLLAGLHGTPLLLVYPGRDAPAELPAFQKALAAAHVPYFTHVFAEAKRGFMTPGTPAYAHDPAEQTWYEIYEFLGKYVEDADENSPLKSGSLAPLKGKRPTTIADIMRTINDPRGLRGKLLGDLDKALSSEKDWERVRSEAALLAEANRWLQTRMPPRGSRAHWLEEIRGFTDVAEEIVAAAERKDQPAMRRALETLAGRCAGCHEKHR
jgi:carboxymethylenebutenolidase